MQLITFLSQEVVDQVNTIVENWAVSHPVLSENTLSPETILAIIEFALNLNGVTIYESAVGSAVHLE